MQEFCNINVLPQCSYAEGAYVELGLLPASLGFFSKVLLFMDQDAPGIICSNQESMAVMQDMFRQHWELQLVGNINASVNLLYRPEHFDLVYDNRLIQARLKPLTSDEITHVNKVSNGPNTDDVLLNKFNIEITSKKLRCMRPGVWLNDEIINFYIQGMLLQRDKRLCQLFPNRKKSQVFNSFFMDKLVMDSGTYRYANVKRWSKRFDAFALD